MSSEQPREQISGDPLRVVQASPRTGATSAPFSTIPGTTFLSRRQPSSSNQIAAPLIPAAGGSHSYPLISSQRPRSISGESPKAMIDSPASSPATARSRRTSESEAMGIPRSRAPAGKKSLTDASVALAKEKARTALKANDSMVYLDGPQVYTCAQCRTHLTSHDDIISKSFHGRHGRAYLFDLCVNVTRGPSEERRLMTGLHTVCDIFCKRCKGMVGWTYLRAYESSQKYKEGKFIIEKINLHLEESDYYEVNHPAGERSDRWRRRSMSWGSESSGPGAPHSSRSDIIYEYEPSSTAGVPRSPRDREASNGATSISLGSSPNLTQFPNPEGPPAPPFV